MHDPLLFYQEQLAKYNERLQSVKEQLLRSSLLRLAVFGLAAVALYLTYGSIKISIAIVLVTITVFLYLVSRHTDLQNRQKLFRALAAINKTEIEVLARNFHKLPAGNEYKDPLHYFSQDIDLFGRGSIYQYANRTALKQGSDDLAKLLTENTIDSIPQKQQAIKELSAMPEWRQDFSATATLTHAKSTTDTIVGWLKRYKPFIPKAMYILPWIFSVASVAVFASYFFDFIPETFLVIWLLIGLGISGIYLSRITKLSAHATKIQSTFQQYNQLLLQIENTEFKSELLRAKKQQILSEKEKTSAVIRKFSKLLNSLDKNNNFIYLIFANGFFLRTLLHTYHVEVWIQKYGDSVEKWFKTIAFFDAYNSLGNFAYNHPEYTYPEISNGTTTLKSIGAGHPLLHPEKSVLNDFQIDKHQFFIITGANMAGKSTFLRTVSLQIVMANVGLPVCSKKVEYTPIKLITSMRTTDSLTDDESYFFSELKRLKFIVDEIQEDSYFIVLDEILKGTNSTDKAKGSRKFVERLVSSKSTGIIATHDLSLCEVAKELPQIKNYYFDAEIIDDELHFDYTFKAGICQNMNASFLLKKMRIVE